MAQSDLNTSSAMQVWSRSDDARHRIWSLYDVFKASVSDYVELNKLLEALGGFVGNIHDRSTAEHVVDLVCQCHTIFCKFGAEADNTSDMYFRKCITHLEAQEVNEYEKASAMLSQLHNVAEAFLRGCSFVRITDAAQNYYAHERLFGDTVYKKFPEARQDITEAGTCFAYDRFTASVLHTMRAIEAAAKRITSRRSIKRALANKKDKHGNSYKNQKNDTLGKIADNLIIAADNLRKGTKKEKLQSAAMHLKSIVSALRNPTMHTTIAYSEHDAKLTIDNAREFMNDLCSV